jgi:hypothetical protein
LTDESKGVIEDRTPKIQEEVGIRFNISQRDTAWGDENFIVIRNPDTDVPSCPTHKAPLEGPSGELGQLLP